MAGKSGRSGGTRPGAGRPAKQAKLNDSAVLGKALQHGDPKAFLLAVMADAGNDARVRVDAVKALLPYTYARKGESGKKDGRQEAAGRAASGKFAPSAPPKLAGVLNFPPQSKPAQ